MQAFVYFLTNKKNGVIYIGVTNNLLRRVFEHKSNFVKGFTQKYAVHTLVYFEIFNDIYSAIAREKSLKNWRRSWEIELIEKNNPYWKDLYEDII